MLRVPVRTPPSPDRTRRAAWIAWGLVCVVWGTTYLAIRVGVRSWEPLLFAGIRFTTAGALVIAALWWRGVRVPRDAATLRDLAIVGVLLITTGNACVVWAERAVPSGIAAVLVSTVPIWTVVIASLASPARRLPREGWIGLVTGLAGIVLLVWPSLTTGAATGRASGALPSGALPSGDPASGTHEFLLGVIVLQVACVSWASGSVYASRHRAAVPPLLGAGAQMVAGGTALLIAGTARGEWAHLAPTLAGWQALLYLITFGSIVGYGAYVYALEHLPVSTVALYAYVNPVVAVLAGAVVLGEHFGARELVATAIVLISVAAAQRRAPTH